MDIIVVRHGIAMDREEAQALSIDDADRALTSTGRKRFKRVARSLSRQAPDLGSIVTSPLRRAVETAELLAAAYEGLDLIRTAALLPEAQPDELVRALADPALSEPIAVVGHEPHLSQWVSYALTGSSKPLVELKKGGACLLRFDGAPTAAGARLLWLAQPALLRRARRR